MEAKCAARLDGTRGFIALTVKAKVGVTAMNRLKTRRLNAATPIAIEFRAILTALTPPSIVHAIGRGLPDGIGPAIQAIRASRK